MTRFYSSPARVKLLSPLVISDYTTGSSMRQIADVRRLCVSTVDSILRKAKVVKRSSRSDYQQFKYDESMFDIIDTAEKAYWLGLLYADGCVSNENRIVISLQERDGYLVSELSKALSRGQDLTRPFSVKRFRGIGLSVTSKRLASSLRRHGCIPAKSMTIRLPKLNKEMMRHFFRGYFDGDGCFSHSVPKRGNSTRGIFKIVSNTRFCQDWQKYLDKILGVYMGVYHPSPNPEVGSLQCGNDKTLRILHRFMYDGATIFLKRKRQKIEEYLALKP